SGRRPRSPAPGPSTRAPCVLRYNGRGAWLPFGRGRPALAGCKEGVGWMWSGQEPTQGPGSQGVAVDAPLFPDPRSGGAPALAHAAPDAPGDAPSEGENLFATFRSRLIDVRRLGWPSRAVLGVAVGLILLAALALATRQLPQPLLDVTSAKNHVAQTYQIPL